jgi:hypothetical protein
MVQRAGSALLYEISDSVDLLQGHSVVLADKEM